MSSQIRLALLGFTEFEHDAFESYFRLVHDSGPVYRLVDDPDHADFLIVDADDDAASERAQGANLMARAILLGGTPRAGAALQLPRPINPSLVVQALGAMAPVPAASAPAAPALPAGLAAAATPAANGAQRDSPVDHVQRVLETLALCSRNDTRGAKRAAAALRQGPGDSEPASGKADAVHDAYAATVHAALPS